MKILLDTHTFLWFINADSQLSAHARQLIEATDNEKYISIASLWELAIKIGQGKLGLAEPFEAYFTRQIAQNGFLLLGLSITHVAEIVTLPFHHKDPFDRLLIAQAMVEGMPVISRDTLFDAYSIKREW